MLSGPQGLKALDEALKDIRREEDTIIKRIARASERIAKLRETEVALLRDLARVRLAPETQAQVEGQLSAAEARAHDMLTRHARAMGEAETALSALEARLAALSTEREEALATLAEHRDTLEAIVDRLSDALESDTDFAARRESAHTLARMAEQAERKAEQAEADRQEKGAPYRNDPLFTYLWDKRYGTADYTASPLVRYLDGQVARLVRFATARPNYAMLTVIPERLRDHAARLRTESEEARAALEVRELEAIDTAGGKPVREAIAEREARLAAIDAELVVAEDERDALTAKQKTLAEGGDPTFEEAVGLLARAMGDEDVAALLAQARATGTPDDDAIVVKIEDARLRLNEEEMEISDQRTRLETLEARRRELEDIAYEYRTARYDDPRARYGEDRLTGDMLNDFLKGAISASAYWAHWRNSQGWQEPRRPARPRPSGFPLPPGGFSPRPPAGGQWGEDVAGEGFSRPRTGQRGTRESKRFRTGGGF